MAACGWSQDERETSHPLSASASTFCDDTDGSCSETQPLVEQEAPPCDVHSICAEPTKHFRRVSFKAKFRFVPEFRVWCRHGEYEMTHVLRCSDVTLGATDVTVYTRKHENCACLDHVVVKTVDQVESDSEVGNVRATRFMNLSHKMLVDANVVYEPPDEEAAAGRGPEAYTAVVMPPCPGNLREAMPVTFEAKMHAFRRVAYHVNTLWTAAGLAYLDMKTANVLVTSLSAPEAHVVLCDYGAMCARGCSGGNATYPPPSEPSGLDVPATEASVCWGLGVLLVTLFEPDTEEAFRFTVRATRSRPGERKAACLKLRSAMNNARAHFQTYMPRAAQHALDECWRSFIAPSPSRLLHVLQTVSAF